MTLKITEETIAFIQTVYFNQPLPLKYMNDEERNMGKFLLENKVLDIKPVTIHKKQYQGYVLSSKGKKILDRYYGK